MMYARKSHFGEKYFELSLILSGVIMVLLMLPLMVQSTGATAIACPVTDGGAGDGDATVDGTITISSNTTWDTSSYSAQGDYWDCTGLDIHVTSSRTLTFEGDTANGYVPFLKADNVTIDSGSKISATGQGCESSLSSDGYGPNASNVCTISSAGYTPYSLYGGGAGYGGSGGYGKKSSTWAEGGVTYGGSVWPILFGSSGSGASSKVGGSGGGVVQIETSSTITLNGSIVADGNRGTVQSGTTVSSGGSGGSILLVADTVAGTTGSLSAAGSTGRNNGAGEYSGGAGGGRVAVYANTASAQFSTFTAATVAAGGAGGGSSTAEDGEDGTYELNPSKTPAIVRARAYDNTSSNSQIDTIVLEFNQVMDSSTIATSDFTTSDSRTVTAVSVNLYTVTLTLTETGSADLDDSFSVNVVSSISGESGGSVSSLSFGVLSPSCSYVDGTQDDHDRTINQIFTVSRSNTTWTPVDDNGEVCTGQALVVNNSKTLTFAGDPATGYYTSYTGADITIGSSSSINADEEGCSGYDSSGLGVGSGPGVNNVCAYDGDGGGDGSVSVTNIGAGGGSHGGAGGDGTVAATTYSAGSTHGTENNPLSFGSTGGHTDTHSSYYGGAGGGIIHLVSSGTFTLDGALSADGGSGLTGSGNKRSGGGSGGSINITAQALDSSSNTCDISAAGGASTGDGVKDAGAGGGGRVSFRVGSVDASMTCYSSLTASDTSAAGVSSYDAAYNGSNGTLNKAGLSSVPDTPSNSSPSDSATSVSREPTLNSSAFSGTDSHLTSTWQLDNNSDFSSPEWTAEEDETNLVSIVVNSSNGVFANDLSGYSQLDSDTYYYRVLHTNVSGDSAYSSVTSFTTQNSAPSVSSIAGSQRTDATDIVDLSFNLADSDGDEFTKAKIELSTDGGSTWIDPTLTEAVGPPSVTNASVYQIESVDTSGETQSISSSFAASNFSGFDGSIQFRVTPNDGTLDGTVASSTSITVDAVAPTEAASFTNSSASTTTADFTWTASTETNLANYEIWYGTNQTHVEAQGGTASEWDNSDDTDLATVSTASTTITGLTSDTTYYAVICAVDDFGKNTCGSSAVSFATVNAPEITSYSAAQTTDADGDIDFTFTVNDGDGGTLDVKVEYSTDASTWSDPTLSGNAYVDNAETYQLQDVDVSGGAQTLNVTWDAATDLASSTDDDTVYLRLTGTDGSNVGTSVGADTAFIVDFVAPVAASTLTSSSETSSSIDFTWTAGAESHFDQYKIWYGSNQASVEAKTSSSWTTSDQANLNTRTTASTSITSLTEATTYYFLLCAHDDYGYESCSSTYTAATGATPTVSTITVAQKTDDSGVLDVSAVFNDIDGDDLRAKIELSTDGGSSWSTITLSITDSDTTASAGDPGVNNAGTYRLGISGEYIDTSGGQNTVTFDIPASNFADTDVNNAKIRITPNDLGGDGTAATSSSFVIDTVNPSVPANFVHGGGIPGIMILEWDFTTETNFDHYEIWYGKDQSKVDAKTTSGLNAATEFDNDPDDSDLAKQSTTSVVINGLDTGATYYAMICAVDDYGNEGCTSSITVTENEVSFVTQISTSQTSTQRSSGYLNICAGKIVDGDNPTTMQLGADYSTDSGATWTKMDVVSGSITATTGSTPSLDNSAEYQIGQVGAYIDMSAGENEVCFNWDYRSDVGSSLAEDVEFRFRPYDGTKEGDQLGGGGSSDPSGGLPPIAKFSYSCTGLVCGFDASASSARSGSIASYSWAFGGGSTGTGDNPANTYDSAGSYYVTLEVTDTYGKTDTKQRLVRPNSSGDETAANNAPDAQFTYSCDDLVCSFTNESTDSDGTISSYAWDFGGDGTSSSTSPSKTFSAAGYYRVKLTATDNDGDTDIYSDSIYVNTVEIDPDPDPLYAPTAVIAIPTCTALACDFDATGSSDSDGTISSYLWSFGDLSGANTNTPSHTYDDYGTYTVSLYVTDNDGLEGGARTRVTLEEGEDPVIPNLPPTAAIAKPDCVGLVCTFDGTGSTDSDGTISAYTWSFGDGASDTVSGSSASHTYSRGGSYIVTLNVTDDDGDTGFKRLKINPVGTSNGGFSLYLDEVAPTDLSTIASTANTSATLTMDWSQVTEPNFYRYEIWVGTDETKVNNRDISAPNGAFRWDEGFDVDMLTQNDADTIVSGLSENTTYFLKIWAKDSYGNESTIDAVSYKTNDRPDLSSGSEAKATNGTGQLTFTSTFDDLDDVDTIKGQYYYNIGLGWEPMTLLSASAGSGSPAVSGNEVGTAEGYIPSSAGANEVAAIWDSKADLPTADTSSLKIRVIPNDSTENGDALVLEDIILDNKAPEGLAGGAASVVSVGRKVPVSRSQRQQLSKVLLARETTSVTVSWTPVSSETNWSGIAAYWVEYGTTSGSLGSTWNSTNDSALTTMSTSSTTITSLETGSTYYFKVYAQDAYGNQSSTDEFSVVASSGGSSSGSGGSLSQTGGIPLAVLQQNEKDFEFEYELPGHWSDDYIDEFLSSKDTLDWLEDNEQALEFAYSLLENPDRKIEREESVLLMSILTDQGPSSSFGSENENRYDDLNASNPLAELIWFHSDAERIEGHGDGSFKPQGETTRVEALKFIQEFLGQEQSKFRVHTKMAGFPDVFTDRWYSGYLETSLKGKVVEGYDDGSFRPSRSVSLAEILKMAMETQKSMQK